MTKRGSLKRQNRRSSSQEKEVAQELGGRVQAGSGSSWRAPRDVRTPAELVELKYTDKKTFVLDARAWQHYAQDATIHGREPVMIIDFEAYNLRLKITEA